MLWSLTCLFIFAQRGNIPEAKDCDILEFHFSDLPVSEFDLIRFGIRCFFELNVIEKFKVPAEVSGATKSCKLYNIILRMVL